MCDNPTQTCVRSGAAGGAPAPLLPTFEWSATADTPKEHFNFGQALGAKFADTIRARFADKASLSQLLQMRNTSKGAKLFDAFVEAHERLAPDAMQEVRGIAKGAELPFDAVFLQNIPLEYSDCYEHPKPTPPGGAPAAARGRDDHCSDFSLCSADPKGECLLGHNEDNAREDLNRSALVKATFGDTHWTGYTYLGELPSGAFGFNSHGVGFTLNWLGPTDVQCPGLGRGFISRSILDAKTVDEAVRLATTHAQSAGHNYQLFDTLKQTAFNLEAAPRGEYAVRPIDGDSALFHANEYIMLAIPQVLSNSSIHRMARAAQLVDGVRDTKSVLAGLGDQKDHAWPVFHDDISHAAGDLSDWTINSALFDLRRHSLKVYWGNPGTTGVVVAEEPLPH